MKLISFIFASIISMSALANEEKETVNHVLDVCKTSAGIRNLYAIEKNFDGLSKEILLQSWAASTLNGQDTQETLKQALKNFSIYSKNGVAIISSNNLPFTDCMKITNSCEDVRRFGGDKYELTSICTPIGSKVTLKIF